MIITNQSTAKSSTTMISIAIALMIALPSISYAEGWELRTTSKEVPGTREIESGQLEKGIALSKKWLPHINYKLKVAALTNLCIGHILIRDLEQAEVYCDQAVARPNQRAVTLSNRGVLKALQGDDAAAQRDFSAAANAGCRFRFNCDETKATSGKQPYQVALRNLERIEPEALAFDAADETWNTAQKD